VQRMGVKRLTPLPSGVRRRKDDSRPLVERISALSFLHCFDTVSWVTGGHRTCKKYVTHLLGFSSKTRGGWKTAARWS